MTNYINMAKQIKSAMRLVHIDNIPHILKHGIVHSKSRFADPNYISIGDKTLIASRRDYTIPGTNLLLGDFIPFYFGPRSPMLFEIQKGFNNVVRRNPQELVYCIIMIDDVINNSLDGFFTDGHAKNAMTKFYSNTLLPVLNDYVSYDDVYEAYWGTAYDNTGETKRKKSAELLLKEDISPELIKWFVVYNESAEDTLIKYGVSPEKIFVNSKFYY